MPDFEPVADPLYQPDYYQKLTEAVGYWRDGAEQLALDQPGVSVIERAPHADESHRMYDSYGRYITACLALGQIQQPPSIHYARWLPHLFDDGLRNVPNHASADYYKRQHDSYDWGNYVRRRLSPKIIILGRPKHLPETWLEVYRGLIGQTIDLTRE